ncbi:hypothetical protein B0H13DRAFT_1852492 [Mycena leptocephala]|nr:hypothetical protein B0H13DRAFT_1852492 [Mycena leptocephala]
MAMTLEFVGGKINHLIMDWRMFDAPWIDDQNIYLLDEGLLIVLSLFYSDPASRVLVMTAKPLAKHSSSASPRNWLFINEGYFRGAPSRRDRLEVPWRSWGQYCLIKDLSRSRAVVRGPYTIGSRVVFLESEKTLAGSAASLDLIEFAPFSDSSTRLNPTWSMMGPRSTLFPSETAPHLPSNTVEHYAVDDLGVTEDNIVLFLTTSRSAFPQFVRHVQNCDLAHIEMQAKTFIAAAVAHIGALRGQKFVSPDDTHLLRSLLHDINITANRAHECLDTGFKRLDILKQVIRQAQMKTQKEQEDQHREAERYHRDLEGGRARGHHRKAWEIVKSKLGSLAEMEQCERNEVDSSGNDKPFGREIKSIVTLSGTLMRCKAAMDNRTDFLCLSKELKKSAIEAEERNSAPASLIVFVQRYSKQHLYAKNFPLTTVHGMQSGLAVETETRQLRGRRKFQLQYGG